MNAVTRFALVAGTCFLGGALFCLEEGKAPDISPPGATAERGFPLDFEVGRRADLEKRLECVRHIISLQEQIVSNLTLGKLSVADAAAQFRELEKMTPGANHGFFQRVFPGASDGERYCRQVIDRAVLSDTSNPPEHEALRSRLETEFKSSFMFPGRPSEAVGDRENE
jgi:hypothetical protein